MSELILVTGATGFIGRYLVAQLRASHVPVRALVRDPRRLAAEVRERIEVVHGDACDRSALAEATGGVHTVLHLAACARAWSADPGEFRRVNVEAVERLLEAAERADIQRFVHVSTVLTLPPYRAARGWAETQAATPYETTKREGEALVESYAAAGRHGVIVHPTRVYGPGPLNDANGVTRLIALYLAGRFRVRIADGDVLANYVHVEDVASGVWRAARRGRSGAHYPLGGAENISLREFLDLLGELSGRRRWTAALPACAAVALAYAERLRGGLGAEISLTPGWIRVFLEDRRVDIAASRRELNYRPRPLGRGLAQTIDWLRREGR